MNTPNRDFYEKGFLADSVAASVVPWSESFAQWVKLFQEVNTYALKLFSGLKPKNGSPQELLAFAIFYRFITNYEAVFLMQERGMDLEAKIMLRCLVENLFVISATVQHADFAVTYCKADLHNKMKVAGGILEAQKAVQKLEGSNYVENARVPDIRKRHEELKALSQQSDWVKTKEVEIWKVAEKAGLKPTYERFYRYYCLFAHATPSSIETNFVVDEAARTISFNIGQENSESDMNLREAMFNMIGAMGYIAALFKPNIKDDLAAFSERLEILTKEYEKSHPA